MKRVEEFRRDLHQIPELGGLEYKTKAYILKVLAPLDIKIYEPTETAVVAYIDSKRDKTICFRADMDGLAILEKTNLDFTSTHSNRMHACGHDGHMAMLLDYILWAVEHKNELLYNVVCLFQPSEEEHAGALDILASGILDTLRVEEIYGFHIWPTLDKGCIYTKPGALLASSSEVNIEFMGKSSHAADQELGIDALSIAASFILDCNKEFIKIKEKHLISFGTMHSGTARNIISDYTVAQATMRNYSDDTFILMKNILFCLKDKYERTTGIHIKITILDLYKSVLNHEDLILKYKDKLNLKELNEPLLQAEDFGCYTRKYKSLFMLIGTGRKSMLHTNTFDFDMDILATGVEAYKIISKK